MSRAKEIIKVCDEARFTPGHVSDTVAQLLTATVDDVKGGKIPLAFYGGNELGPEIVAQYKDGKIRLFNGFFEMSPEDRPSLLWHEFGHEVTRIAFADHNEETNSILRLFKVGNMRYDNFAGASYRPDEMIADIYSQAMGAKEPLWEDPDGRFAKATSYVLDLAKEAGLPVPKWFN